MENILKIHYLKKYHPDIALFIQTSPAFCCPSLITEAMAHRIEKVTLTPIVAITYDGTGGNKNEAVAPYLAFPRQKRQANADKIVHKHVRTISFGSFAMAATN